MFTKKIILLGVFIFMVGALTYAQDFKYIGAAKCKMCHNKPEKGEQYNKWSGAIHANAMKSLSAEEAKKPECLKCHSTAASVDQSLLSSTITVEEGVSCESCHGPGSAYKSMTVMKNREQSVAKGLVVPTEETCKKCHNEESPNFKGFNFEEYAAQIAHPKPSK